MSVETTRQGAAALKKGLHVFDLIADAEKPPRFVDLVAQSGLPKSTLHRLLQTLMDHGLVQLNQETHTYSVGLRTLDVARRFWEGMDLRQIAAAEIAHLAEVTGETVHLGVRDGTEVVYIDKVDSQESIRMFSRIGRRGPLHCTGVGKVLLAFADRAECEALIPQLPMTHFTPNTFTDPRLFRRELQEIRARGYAYDLEEHELGVRCLSAPVFDHRRRVAASISVTAPIFRMDMDRLAALAPVVVETAHRITRAMGGAPPEAGA
ncbi:IclR family transcriptional regulator [Telmatospirillum sp. J64-1]|uniref:IclR family transcriptional regulator n=1 Tax=Telmatospirillum sp. J64-1 TaxID=2502183 RepID=UPI00115D8D5A|nr:IclR family transcriptional regulator [Telmatospirillum sp. J64-1]